jgi:peptidoglycan/LPS O-acetylase OafA/YrhL
MAIGGLGAYLIFSRKQEILRFVFHPAMQIAAVVALPAIILFTPTFLYKGLYLLLSVPCLIIIMNVGCNDKCLYKLRHSWLNYLGKISYGIYMYHLICITFAYNLVDYWMELPFEIPASINVLIYVVSIALTIGVSALSYRFIEKPFIHRKKKYAIVQSGDKV